jgi:beta-lactamase class A
MVNISTSNIKPWGSWDKEVQQRTSAFLGSLVDITANAAADIFNPNPFIDFSGGKNAWFKKIIEDSWSSLSNTQVVTPSETKPPQNISSETKSPSVTDVDKVSNALKGKGMSLVSMIVLDKEGKQVSSTASQKIGGDSDSSVASLMKMPIALAYIDLVKDGKIKNPDKQSLSLMLEKSDNKAANKIIDQVKSLLPAGDDPYKLFNDKFKELGFSNTILRRKFDDPVVSDATGKPIKNESTTADLAKAMNTLTSQSSSSADVDPLYKAAQKALAEASKAHGFLSPVAGNKEVKYSKYGLVGDLTALSLKMKNGETVVIYAKSNNSLEKEPEVTVAFNSMMAAIGQR